MKRVTKTLIAAVTLAIVGTPLMAADLKAPVYKAPPPPPPPVFTWTGCYIGVHAGGGWGTKDWSDPSLGGIQFSSHDVNGALAGGQIGCDIQSGPWVFGLEGQGSWADLKGDSIDSLSDGTVTDHTKVDALGTITARIGYAWDRTLLYVKGGAAVASDKYFLTDATLGGITFASTDHTRWGWTVGAGLEWAFAPSWSVKVEYNFMDFGKDGVGFFDTIALTPFTFDIDQQIHTAKVGLNYRFNWGPPPVAARY